jgi:enolase-phosphatase E1
MLTAVVIDIEGTTSSTSFVASRLYPYSADRLASWMRDHHDDTRTRRAVAQVRELIGEPSAGPDRIVAVLLDWLASDQKVTPLKTLQGLIWEQGFSRGDLIAHFYPDAIPALRAWTAAGRSLHVFSSGSAAAQRAWFSHSPEGDLRPLVSGYFDTENAGPKRDASSYQVIAMAIRADPGHIVFLSDLAAELDAARQAGWHTVGVRRPGEKYYENGIGRHLEVSSLTEVDLSGDWPVLTT